MEIFLPLFKIITMLRSLEEVSRKVVSKLQVLQSQKTKRLKSLFTRVETGELNVGSKSKRAMGPFCLKEFQGLLFHQQMCSLPSVRALARLIIKIKPT